MAPPSPPPLSGAKPHAPLHAEPGERRIQPALSVLPAAHGAMAPPLPMRPMPVGMRPPVMAQTQVLPSNVAFLQQQYTHRLFAAPPRYGVRPPMTRFEVAYAHGLFAMNANLVSTVPHKLQPQPPSSTGHPLLPPSFQTAETKLHHSWSCENCSIGFAEQSHLESHVDDHRECVWPGCSFVGSKTRVRAHVVSVHEAKPVTERDQQATEQGNQASTDTTRGGAGTDVKSKPTRWCQSCDRTFGSKIAYESHVNTHVSCREPHCDFQAPKRVELERFEAVHQEQSSSAQSQFKSFDEDGVRSFVDDITDVDNPDTQERQQASTSVPPLPMELDPKARDDEMRAALIGKLDFKLDESQPEAPSPSPTKKGNMWYCVACDQESALGAESKAHMSSHVSCLAPGCQFSASKEIVLQHFLAARGQKQVTNEPRRPSSNITRVSQDIQVWRRGGSLSVRTRTSPPTSYCCKTCSVPGRWFIGCPRYGKPVDAVAYPPVSWRQQERRPLQLLPPRPSLDPAATAPPRSVASDSKPYASTGGLSLKLEGNYATPWRSEACAKALALESQRAPPATESSLSSRATPTTEKAPAFHQAWFCETCLLGFPEQLLFDAHLMKHTWCRERGCAFSGIKRVMKAHVKSVHPEALLGNQATSKSCVKRQEGGVLKSEPLIDLEILAIRRALQSLPPRLASQTIPGYTWEVSSSSISSKSPEPSQQSDSQSSDDEDESIECSSSSESSSPQSTHRTSSHNTLAWRRGDTLPERIPTVPSSSYCRICSTRGHRFIDCPTIVAPGTVRVRANPLRQEKHEESQQQRSPPPWVVAASRASSSVFERRHDSAVVSTKSEEKAMPWECETCNKAFPLESELESHFANHAECPEPACSYSAPKRVVIQHLLATHGSATPPNAYRCELCGVPGHWIFNCEQLDQGHKGKKKKKKKSKPWLPIQCEPCGKSFALEKHLQTHTERHVVCSEPSCEFSAAKHVVKAHARTHKLHQVVEVQPFAEGSDESASGAIDEAENGKPNGGEVCETEPQFALQHDLHFASEVEHELPADAGSLAEPNSPHSTPRSSSGGEYAKPSPTGSALGDQSTTDQSPEPTNESETSLAISDTPSQEVVVQGRKYQLQEIIVDGLTCMVLVDAAGSISQ